MTKIDNSVSATIARLRKQIYEADCHAAHGRREARHVRAREAREMRAYLRTLEADLHEAEGFKGDMK